MANPGTMLGAFTDELGDLGKNIVREAVAVPKDVAGTALESLGVSSGQKSSGAGSRSAGQLNKTVAREALAQLAGGKPKQKEPTAWEKIQAEAEQKKELAKQQQKQASTQQLPAIQSKRKRGDLYGMKAKKAGSEVGKNVRQD